MKKAILIIVLIISALITLLIIGKKSLYSEIIINAPIDRVWKEFTDFPEYPRWNPFIKKVTGEMKTGSIVNIRIQPKGHKPVDFNPTLLVYKEKSMIQWEGMLYIPGIFTGRHCFELISIDKNTTKFIQKEDFNGILVPFFNLDSTLDGFKEMNSILKNRVEKER